MPLKLFLDGGPGQPLALLDKPIYCCYTAPASSSQTLMYVVRREPVGDGVGLRGHFRKILVDLDVWNLCGRWTGNGQ